MLFINSNDGTITPHANAANFNKACSTNISDMMAPALQLLYQKGYGNSITYCSPSPIVCYQDIDKGDVLLRPFIKLFMSNKVYEDILPHLPRKINSYRNGYRVTFEPSDFNDVARIDYSGMDVDSTINNTNYAYDVASRFLELASLLPEYEGDKKSGLYEYVNETFDSINDQE